MKRSRSHITRAIAAALLLFGSTRIAIAQSPVDFYKNRNIDEYIGYSTGGAYDFYARVIGRHMGVHIPGNPTLVPRNMEGAGSLRLANWLYRVAPQDGSVFATFGRGIAFDPLLIGQFPRVLNGILGTHFKIVAGYPGGNDVVLAMERGEVQGRCGWSWSSVKSTHKSWIDENKMVVLVQLSLNKHPELPDVPSVIDFAKTDEQRTILKMIFARQVMGRPYVSPPNLPADRVAVLRQAFMDTMKDKDFLAEADKTQLEVNPVSGQDVEKLVKDIYATPPDIVAKAKEAAK